MYMHCKKCGSSLPSHGFICLSCGAMMDSEQIKLQKEYRQKEDEGINIRSDGVRTGNVEFKEKEEHKFLGALLILLVLLILLIIAIIKVL